MGTRKILQVIFKEGVGTGSYKSFDVAQPTLNTGAKIENISMAEESRGVLVQWTDHHTRQNALLVPYGNIKCITYDSSTMTQPEAVEVKPKPQVTVVNKAKAN